MQTQKTLKITGKLSGPQPPQLISPQTVGREAFVGFKCVLIRDSCQENSLMQPTKFPSYVPKEMKLSVFTLCRHFTSLKLPAVPSRRERFPSALAQGEAAVPAGVPTGQLRGESKLFLISIGLASTNGFLLTPNTHHHPHHPPGLSAPRF